MAMKLLARQDGQAGCHDQARWPGRRDTLRLEAGMPLYGHELTETIDPISAGLGWAVDLTKDFIGVEPLRKIEEQGPEAQARGPGAGRQTHRPPGNAGEAAATRSSAK